MKDGLRFVDSDMHIMEPPDLFDRYLDRKFKHRVTVQVGADGRPARRGTIIIDGLPTSEDATCSSTASASGPAQTQSTQPLSGSRLFDTGRLDFAIQRDYDPEAQVMGMEMEGVDIAVLYPDRRPLPDRPRQHGSRNCRWRSARPTTTGSTSSAGTAPTSSSWWRCCPCTTCTWPAASCCGACASWARSGSFIRPNLVNGHYWHSNYWDPLYSAARGARRHLGLPRGHGRAATRT